MNRLPLARAGKSPLEIFEALAVVDIREAADLLRPLYDQTNGSNGYVSLEVNPTLAYETEETLSEAKRLWASTGTKNPAYPDTLYVDELVGPNTVNTMPPATLDAFRDHGRAELKIESDLDGAHRVFTELEALGISMAEVTQELEEGGVKSFADSFESLLNTIASRQLVST